MQNICSVLNSPCLIAAKGTEDLPVNLQAEISTSLQSVSGQSLWEIAKETVHPTTWVRHQDLLEKNQAEGLNQAELRN